MMRGFLMQPPRSTASVNMADRLASLRLMVAALLPRLRRCLT